MSRLEKQFHDKALEIYELAKDLCGYSARRYLQKVRNDGGLKAAKSWLKPRKKVKVMFRFRSVINSSMFLKDGRPPRRASFIAAMVSSLGTSGSKGSFFSLAMRVIMMRKASYTVSPIAANTSLASSLMRSSMRARTTAFTGIDSSS